MNGENLVVGGVFTVTCRDKNGKFKWQDTIKNRVVNEGLEHILDVLFEGGSGTSQIGDWYVGLLTTTPTVDATDGIADLPEFSAYDGDRKLYIDVRSSQTVSNSSSKASFTIDSVAGGEVVGGAFLCSAASGTTGTLLCGGAFTNGDKSDLDDADTLEVQYNFSAANGT